MRIETVNTVLRPVLCNAPKQRANPRNSATLDIKKFKYILPPMFPEFIASP